jgi:hypothetical protein
LVTAGQDRHARPLLDDLLLDGFAGVAAQDYDVTQAWARAAELSSSSALAAREEALSRASPPILPRR